MKHQIGSDDDLILLLDEPGLSLHALAQADFLAYIDALSQQHQILYTTHSPFMVHSDRLHQVRTVEDKGRDGTKISANISGSDPKTLFPLQAALGYSIAQNLFISPRNLLVEGPADLIYLQHFSALLDGEARESLRDDITVVPTGGLDKVATFIALLGASGLELAVVHDYMAKPDERIQALVQQKVIRNTQVKTYADFRGTVKPAKGQTPALISTDVEDLISVSLYLRLFNETFAKELGGKSIAESDLPQGDRIVDRLTRYLATNSIQVRPTGGFNHYRVASHLGLNPLPIGDIDADTLNRFEQLFKSVNRLFT